MRVALVSDLHGNEIALAAVLADVERLGVDRTVCLGDTATLGPRPEAVLAELRDRGVPCIEGNHDAFLIDPGLVRSYNDAPIIAQAVDWCRAELPAWAIDFVRTFVPSLDIDLGGGTLLRLYHGTPRSHTEDILATTPADALDDMLGPAGATVMAGGHTHIQMLRQHRGVLLVNPGSVGMPFKEYVAGRAPTILPLAESATVDAERGRVAVTLHRVPLDKSSLREAAAASTNPIAPMLVEQYAS